MVLALDEHFDQSLLLQPVQVHARSGWTHTGHYRKFCAGSRMAVHQAKEDANPRRLANSGRYSGDGEIGVMIPNIHTLIINEVSTSNLRHTVDRIMEDTNENHLLHSLPDRSLPAG